MAVLGVFAGPPNSVVHYIGEDEGKNPIVVAQQLTTSPTEREE
jgi:hypothetical protein